MIWRWRNGRYFSVSIGAFFVAIGISFYFFKSTARLFGFAGMLFYFMLAKCCGHGYQAKYD